LLKEKNQGSDVKLSGKTENLRVDDLEKSTKKESNIPNVSKIPKTPLNNSVQIDKIEIKKRDVLVLQEKENNLNVINNINNNFNHNNTPDEIKKEGI